MTSLYEISYYGIEQHITLTLPAWCCLFTVRNYMTLFNTFALRAGRWCSGMSLASYGVLLWFETHTPLCSIRYFLSLTLFCTFCSLFHTMANISIFLSHWHCHINFYFPFSQFLCRCKDWNACKNLVIILYRVTKRDNSKQNRYEYCKFYCSFAIFEKSTRERCLFLFFHLTTVYQGFYICNLKRKYT